MILESEKITTKNSPFPGFIFVLFFFDILIANDLYN